MAEIRVTAQTLATGAEELQQLAEQFRNQYEKLNDTEGNLMGMWEGDAKENFHRAFQSDIIQMQNFYNAILQYVQRLQSASQRYMQAEQMNVDTATTRSYQ